MADLLRFPSRPLQARAFLIDFLAHTEDELTGVVVVGLTKDGTLSGWSTECEEDVYYTLGAIEAFKLDFWNSQIEKRDE